MSIPLAALLQARPVFINLGVRGFGESLGESGYEVIQVDWSPPAGGDPQMAALLDDLL